MYVYKYNYSIGSYCKYTGNYLFHHKIGWLWTFRVTGIKNICLYVTEIFGFSGGFKSLCFTTEAGSIEELNALIYALCCLKSDMNSSLCKLNVQIVGKWFCLIFYASVSFMFYICYFVAVKKEKNEMSFKCSIGPSQPISEITTHVCRLKTLETWLIKDQVF